MALVIVVLALLLCATTEELVTRWTRACARAGRSPLIKTARKKYEPADYANKRGKWRLQAEIDALEETLPPLPRILVANWCEVYKYFTEHQPDPRLVFLSVSGSAPKWLSKFGIKQWKLLTPAKKSWNTLSSLLIGWKRAELAEARYEKGHPGEQTEQRGKLFKRRVQCHREYATFASEVLVETQRQVASNAFKLVLARADIQDKIIVLCDYKWQERAWLRCLRKAIQNEIGFFPAHIDLTR